MASVVVTGGAGYVGSHVVRRLLGAGWDVIVIDDLSEGHRAAVGDATLVVGDFGDPAVLDPLLQGEKVEYVVHMAAFCQVGESVIDPARYYENNVAKSLRLLDVARRYGVKGLVFSSSAAVYGDPVEVPITEEHPLAPTNPYGETKLAFENALSWFHRAYGTRYAALRYFNAAGAHPDGDLGEDHEPESHLIPRLLTSILRGGPPTPIFGEDYPTTDGTCVRDYIHVADLAEAHVAALEALEKGRIEAGAFNLGNGEGFSVQDVIDTVARVTGEMPPTETAPRRGGDPAILVASANRALRRIGFDPAFPRLEEIVRTAWVWHRDHPAGYGDRG
ncbi:MAG: UDP-glucose 4-epimerase GalE [Acidobacteriia bacterium]|nr:UDP-glucose 4-epimerase GalE [Terriglobia bacterium]